MSATAAYVIDRSQYPIIRIRWFREATAAETQVYMRELAALLAEKRKVTLMLVIPAHLSFTTDQQLQVSRWLRDNDDAVTRFFVGMCFVTESVLLGMALRAVFIFAPPKNAWNITDSERDAIKWCRNTQLNQSSAWAS